MPLTASDICKFIFAIILPSPGCVPRGWLRRRLAHQHSVDDSGLHTRHHPCHLHHRDEVIGLAPSPASRTRLCTRHAVLADGALRNGGSRDDGG
ncbi:hypothetical protein ACCO45_000354 [Purpureocillium lilacinum]|uniref:Uncharacterized protein n=1 Tax=Purpureocillium lilacinum TaxID=33203 RepID=A0ACC4E6P5_PURLI